MSSSLTTTLTATQTLSAAATLPSGAQVFVLSQDTGAEAVFPAGTVPSLPAGVYVFEVWQTGQRSFSTNAQLPVMTSQQQIALNDKLDYTLMSGLTPLVRNLAGATQSGNTFAVHFTYDATTIPPPTVSQLAVQRTATPTVTIPVGRYSFPASSAIFYVYPNNVLWLSRGGQMFRLLPSGSSVGVPQAFAAQGFPVSFTATNNNLWCSGCTPNINVVLKGSMRDI
jgi:hypothetical protein